MMAGCPLVVCGAGALTELVQDQRNGLVSRPGDADDLAEKLLSLLKSPARGADLGARAAVDAAERYSPKVVARQTLEFYRTVVGRS
jgi:glycosyltransferase involved in cell wall biosynthesis